MARFAAMPWRGATAMALILAAAPASAAVTYSFEAFSSRGGAFGRFSLTTASFITTNTLVAPNALTNCVVTQPATGP